MAGNITFAMIKPDAVGRKFAGSIINAIENSGFEIVALQKMHWSAKLAEEFYAVHKERSFYRELVELITSGSVIAMVLRRENAVLAWRELMGATDPAKANLGSLRALYGQNIGHNGTHGSDSDENALLESSLVFPELKL